MKNLEELRERIQDEIQDWHRNLEGENQYPHLNKVIYEDEDLNKSGGYYHKEDDLRFIELARQALQEGKRVYYDSWW